MTRYQVKIIDFLPHKKKKCSTTLPSNNITDKSLRYNILSMIITPPVIVFLDRIMFLQCGSMDHASSSAGKNTKIVCSLRLADLVTLLLTSLG